MTNSKGTSTNARAYANTAELSVSDSSFRKADAGIYDTPGARLTHAEILAHQEARANAKEIIFDTFVARPRAPQGEQYWEMQRAASIARMGNVALGSFENYFTTLPALAPSSDLGAEDLPDGEPKIIATNSSVIRFNKEIDDPIEFIEASLGHIQERKVRVRDAVGPENYATTLKFFANKYAALDISDEISNEEIKELVSTCFDGFIDIASKDKPNFIEMTNIHSAIRMLPKGSVDKRYTKPLLVHSLNVLHDSSNQSISTLLGMIPKLDLGEDGQSAAEVVNLALRKSKKFETTYEYRIALRSFTALPKCEATEQALRAFLENRNELERSLNLEGADEVMERLRFVAENVVGSDDLYMEIKQLGEQVGRAASEWTKHSYLEGNYTKDQWQEAQVVFNRMMINYKSI